MITRTQFKANYKAAALRATPAPNGLSFLEEDRVALDEQRTTLRMNYAMAARLIADGATDFDKDYAKGYCRFQLWDQQVTKGVIRRRERDDSPKAVPVMVLDFDGRINTKADIQPAFNRAAERLVKLGITSTKEAETYLHKGFEHVRSEVKIHLKFERVLPEFQMGDLTKDQANAVLDRIKAAL